MTLTFLGIIMLCAYIVKIMFVEKLKLLII